MGVMPDPGRGARAGKYVALTAPPPEAICLMLAPSRTTAAAALSRGHPHGAGSQRATAREHRGHGAALGTACSPGMTVPVRSNVAPRTWEVRAQLSICVELLHGRGGGTLAPILCIGAAARVERHVAWFLHAMPRIVVSSHLAVGRTSGLAVLACAFACGGHGGRLVAAYRMMHACCAA
jgi:hypothetical protein